MKNNSKSHPSKDLQDLFDSSQLEQAQVPAHDDRVETRPTEAVLRRLMGAAGWLQAHQAGLEPSPGFLAASRKRLVARIRTQGRRSWWDRTWARPQVRLVLNSAALALLLVTAVVFNLSLFTTAQVSLPGELLYPFKLGLESARLMVVTDEVQEASLHIDFARERSNELQALILEGEYDYLEITSLRIMQEVNLANQSLALAEDMDPEQRMSLAQDLTLNMEMQNLVLLALRGSIPANSQGVVDYLLIAAH